MMVVNGTNLVVHCVLILKARDRAIAYELPSHIDDEAWCYVVVHQQIEIEVPSTESESTTLSWYVACRFSQRSFILCQ